MRLLPTLGWILVALDVGAVSVLFLGRDSGDAATRGVGPGLGTLLAVLGMIAGTLLWWGARGGRQSLLGLATLVAVVSGPSLIDAAPAVEGVAGHGTRWCRIFRRARPRRIV